MSAVMKEEKLMLSEPEQRAWMKLSANLRKRVAKLLGQPELEFKSEKIDYRKGENSHWHAKRALKIFVVKTPDGRKHDATPTEAAAMVDCSEQYLLEYMKKPLTKFERARTYVMGGNLGETIIMWMPGASRS